MEGFVSENYEQINGLQIDTEEDTEVPKLRFQPVQQEIKPEKVDTEEKIDQILTETEGQGRFKYFAAVAITASMTGCDFVFINLAYMIQEPIYQCKFSGSEDW